jgi:hypothetical protein
MEDVYQRLKHKLPYTVLKQGQKSRNALLEDFKKDLHSVLFATSSFWQGVDVQGEALSCVIIDKLPFASPGEPIIEARIEDLRQRNENPFMIYQVPSAVITLKQGLGRLIRSKQDRGILSILDSRLLTKQYGRVFLESLPRFPIVRDVENIVIGSSGSDDSLPAADSIGSSVSKTMKKKAQDAGPPKSDWELALEGKELSKAQAYSMSEVFGEGELISHPSFGIGVVTALQAENKIEVLFKTGYKVLVHDQMI